MMLLNFFPVGLKVAFPVHAVCMLVTEQASYITEMYRKIFWLALLASVTTSLIAILCDNFFPSL